MSPISDNIVRRRMRAAEELLSSARVLLDRHGRIGVDLSGLGVECALKALVLAHVAASRRQELDEGPEFRGPIGHSYANLRLLFRHVTRGRDLPLDRARDLRLLEDFWRVDMRYDPRMVRASDAIPLWNAASRMITRVRSQIS